MILERLLFTSCLLPGKTKFRENKTSVEIHPEPGETILFFCIDNNSKGDSNCKNCRIRSDLWKNQEGQRICDLLVFYAKDSRRVLCFVELKDNKSDLDGATEKVINTYKAFKPHLRLTNEYSVQAFLIAHHGSAPEQHRKNQNKLQKEFRDDNYIYDGKPAEFADFLRGMTKKKKQRRKNKRKR